MIRGDEGEGVDDVGGGVVESDLPLEGTEGGVPVLEASVGLVKDDGLDRPPHGGRVSAANDPHQL